MIWLLDTNMVIVYANRSRGYDRLARRMSGRTPGELRISAVTLCELEFGIANSRDADENRAVLENVLQLIQVDDLPASAAQHYGEIKSALRDAGRATQPYDLLIGAHARALDAVLVTDNTADFKHMPGLRLENWLRA